MCIFHGLVVSTPGNRSTSPSSKTGPGVSRILAVAMTYISVNFISGTSSISYIIPVKVHHRKNSMLDKSCQCGMDEGMRQFHLLPSKKKSYFGIINWRRFPEFVRSRCFFDQIIAFGWNFESLPSESNDLFRKKATSSELRKPPRHTGVFFLNFG